jgi:hypothetical protein
MEITDFYSEIRIKYMNAPCRMQNLLTAKLMVPTVTTALHRIKHHIIKIYRRVEIQLHAFLTLALYGSGQLHSLVTLPLGGQPDTHSIEDGVDSRAGRKLWRSLSVLWVAYATHSTLKPVPTLPR